MKTTYLLWRLIWYQLGLILLITFLWIVFNTLPLIIGWIFQVFFDMLSGYAQVSLGIRELIVLLVIIGIIRELVRALNFAQEPFITISTQALLSHNLMKYFMSRPGAEAKPYSPGEMISRFQGDTDVIAVFLIWAPTFIGRTIFVIFAVIIMININPLITFSTVTPLIIVVVIIRATRSQTEIYRQATREMAGVISETIGEIFSTVQAIKVVNAENNVIAHFRKLNDKRRLVTVKERLFNQIQNSLFGSTISLSSGIILLMASHLIQTGNFTVGDFALFVYYLDVIMAFINTLGTLLVRLKQVRVSFNRLSALLQEAAPDLLVQCAPPYLQAQLPDISHTSKTATHRLEKLEVSDLTYRFSNSERGIKGISFCLERGSLTVITGRVGAGKTTLLRVLLGQLPKARGDIRWNGVLVENPTTFFVPPRSAYTPQSPRLFSDTLRDNILMGLSEEKVDLPSAIAAAVLEQELMQFKDGLNTRVGSRGVRLSGGQLQRTAAARMFVRNPELLVFDDLSSALDIDTERLFWERLFERENQTCLVVSHRKSALLHADQIIVLKDGKIEEAGHLEQLLITSEEIKHLWRNN